MNSFSQQFTGIDDPTGSGYAEAALAPGWQPLTTLAPAPPNCTGVIISGTAAWSWSLSPDAITADPTLQGMPVPMAQPIAFVGRANVEQMRVRGAATLSIQYCFGSVGAMPIL